MRDWIFISDFDGTMTDRDFHQMVVEHVMPERGAELYRRWREGGMTLLAFLSAVFAGLGMSETELDRFIATIPFDETAAAFIRKVRAAGGDFMVLSAGTGYYIERVLAARGLLDEVRIIANPGVYRDGGIAIRPDTDGPFFSALHGVDKAKVVSAQQEAYRRVYFAGDSSLDAEAAVLAAKVFAKRGLQRRLTERKHPFVPFSIFAEIEPLIEELGSGLHKA